ncbi:unnamed protein product [Urochloa humidicola]
MDHQYPPPPPLYASGPPTPSNGDLEAGHVAVHPRPPPPPAAATLARGLPVSPIHLGGGAPIRNSRCDGHDPSALLVGATLITALAFLLGTFIPGGYWPQDTQALRHGKPVTYRAGDPIMRDLHRPRYWVFRAASWVGVASSMVLTLSLLVGAAAGSRHVRWSFAVAYSSLLLTFAVSQTKTHLSLDVIVWVAVLFVSWILTTTRIRGENRARIMKLLCCSGGDN